MKLKLDAGVVASLALPKGKAEDFAWDTELESFGLRLRRRADGGLLRNWVAQYRADGHTRRVTIGAADKITPAQAREAARKILARVELGHDPQAEKDVKRRQEARTVRAAVASYLATKQSELRPGSFRIATLYLTGPYFRSLHSLAVNAVTRADVAAAIGNITRNHSPATAAAARRLLSAFFARAVADGLLGNGANPVDGTHVPAEPPPRDRVLADNELVAIWRACGEDDFGRIVRLLILLGHRRGEVGGLRWSELSEAGVWILPGERSKNHRAHAIALPPTALNIIASVPRQPGRDLVFGDRADGGFANWSEAKAQLDRALGDSVQPWRIHDLRRTAATKMADIGVEPHVIEAVLNHHGGHRHGVAGIYNRSTYDHAVAAALVRWSEHLLALVEGHESKVVTLRA